MSQTRIYVVINKATNEKRLVEATSQAQAIRHCVSKVYVAEAASPKTVAGCMTNGLSIEHANETEQTNQQTPN